MPRRRVCSEPKVLKALPGQRSHLNEDKTKMRITKVEAILLRPRRSPEWLATGCSRARPAVRPASRTGLDESHHSRMLLALLVFCVMLAAIVRKFPEDDRPA